MKQMVVLGVVCMMLAAATVGLAGCPALGIGGNPTLGKIVVHNNFPETRHHVIREVSVVRVSDECSDMRLEGVNLLPTPIFVGKSFSAGDLPEGRYYCIAAYDYESTDCLAGRCPSEKVGYVTLAAGGTADWYVQ